MNTKDIFTRALRITTLIGLGLILTIGSYRAYAGMPPRHDRPDPLQRLEEHAKDLQLTPDQDRRLAELIKEERAKFETLRDKHRKEREADRKEMDALRNEGKDALSKILSTEQMEKLKELAKNDRDSFRKNRQACREQGRDCDKAPCNGPGNGPGPGNAPEGAPGK